MWNWEVLGLGFCCRFGLLSFSCLLLLGGDEEMNRVSKCMCTSVVAEKIALSRGKYHSLLLHIKPTKNTSVLVSGV